MKTKNLLLVLVVLLGTSVRAQYDNALNFGNFFDDNRVVIPEIPNLDYSNYTVEFWVQPLNYSATNEDIPVFKKKDYIGLFTSYPEPSFGISINFKDYLGVAHAPIFKAWNFTAPNQVQFVNQIESIKLGEWYHLAAVYSGTDLKFYINGVLQGTTHIIHNRSYNLKFRRSLNSI